MRVSILFKSIYYINVYFLLCSNLLGKFIKKGKKIFALKIFFKLKYLIKKKFKKDSNIILLLSLLNSLIKVNFIKKRLGSVKKEIPVLLDFNKSIKVAITAWLKQALQSKGKLNLKKLVLLIGKSYKLKGPVIMQNYKQYNKAVSNRILLRFIK